jgi:hypothetical protein
MGVHNLYKQLFYIPNPTLSFIGLAFKIDPFPYFDYQAGVIVKQLQGLFSLPTTTEMLEEEQQNDEQFKVVDGSREKLVMGYVRQFEYWDWCAEISGKPKTDPKRLEIRQNVLEIRRKVLG